MENDNDVVTLDVSMALDAVLARFGELERRQDALEVREKALETHAGLVQRALLLLGQGVASHSAAVCGCVSMLSEQLNRPVDERLQADLRKAAGEIAELEALFGTQPPEGQ